MPGKFIPNLLPRYPEAAHGIETIILPIRQARTQSPGLGPRENAELDTWSWAALKSFSNPKEAHLVPFIGTIFPLNGIQVFVGVFGGF